MVEALLGEVPTTISPIAVTPRSRSVTPPADLGQLWEKDNKALEELLATKLSIEAHRQKAVWELGRELCWNDSETVESIKEARAICTCVATDAGALCFSIVKKAKATCAHTIWEAETACTAAIREAETRGASQAESLHGWHSKTIKKHLEEQVIQEEGKSQIDFLSACQAALYTSPAELRGALVASNHILMGQAPTSHPFTLSQGASPAKQPSASAAPPLPAPEHSPRPKRWHPCPDPGDNRPLGGTMSKATSEGPPSSKQWEVPPWYKVLKQSHSEAFSWDTSPVKEARKEYFKRHSLTFTMDGTCDLSEVFRHMAESVKLLGLAIYEIQEVWKGPDELQQANYALRSLTKGLKFFWAVPPSESPKVMGLVGIHNPDTLHHFNGLTHCPWCGKEGQNEGTVVNHLWTVHYRLGLVCNKCYDYLSTSSDTLHHHGWQNCPPSREGDLDESASSE